MSLPEDVMRYLEDHIPELAEPAFTQAFWQALADGSPVLVQQGDALVEISPNGARRVVRPLPGSVPVPSAADSDGA